jgi:hypothetical protein
MESTVTKPRNKKEVKNFPDFDDLPQIARIEVMALIREIVHLENDELQSNARSKIENLRLRAMQVLDKANQDLVN